MAVPAATDAGAGSVPDHPPLPEWRRTAAFAAVLVAFVLEVADSTIVNTALPQIRAGIGGGASAMQWIAAAYFLTLGSLLLIGGRLGDLFGFKRVFMTGIAAFVVASCLCGLARTAEELVAARLLQGAAAALMAPQVMAIVQVLYTPLERVNRLAWFGVIGGLAAIVGPILGGLLIEANVLGLGWRTIFLINLPVGVLALAAAWRFLPPRPPVAATGIDRGGAMLFVAAFALVLLALIEGPELGWPLWTAAAALAGLVMLALGWRHARRRASRGEPAVIAPELFGLPSFRWGMAAVTVFSAGVAGFLLVFAVSLQQGLGLSALDTALRHVPFGLGVMAGISLIGRKFLPRIGKWIIVAGAVVIASAGTLALHRIAQGQGSDIVLALLLLAAGIGMGMVMGPLPPVIMSKVPREKAGTGSAMMRTAQQLGGALGIAVLGAVFFYGGAEALLQGLYPAAALFAAGMAVTLALALQLPRDLFGEG